MHDTESERDKEAKLVASVLEEIRACPDWDSALPVLRRCRDLGLSVSAHARLLSAVSEEVRAELETMFGTPPAATGQPTRRGSRRWE